MQDQVFRFQVRVCTVGGDSPAPVVRILVSFTSSYLTAIIYLLVIVSLILPATMADSFKKIAVANPVVELDGDEMTRIIWKKIREEVSRFFHSPLNAG